MNLTSGCAAAGKLISHPHPRPSSTERSDALKFHYPPFTGMVVWDRQIMWRYSPGAVAASLAVRLTGIAGGQLDGDHAIALFAAFYCGREAGRLAAQRPGGSFRPFPVLVIWRIGTL